MAVVTRKGQGRIRRAPVGARLRRLTGFQRCAGVINTDTRGYAHRGWNFWSCVRYNGNNAWIANGGNGFLANNNMYNGNRSLPVSN